MKTLINVPLMQRVKGCLVTLYIASCCQLTSHSAQAQGQSDTKAPQGSVPSAATTKTPPKTANNHYQSSARDASATETASNIFKELAIDKFIQVFNGRIYGFSTYSWSFQGKGRPESITPRLENSKLFNKMTQLSSTWLLQGGSGNFSLLLQIDWHKDEYLGLLMLTDMSIQHEPADIPDWLPKEAHVISQLTEGDNATVLIITSRKSAKALGDKLLLRFKKMGWEQVNFENEGFLEWQSDTQAVRAYLQAAQSGSGSEGLIMLLNDTD